MMSFAVLAIAKATVVCAAALVAARFCKRTSAAVRHMIFALAFGALVAIPVGSAIVMPLFVITLPAPVSVEPAGPSPQRVPAATTTLSSETTPPARVEASRTPLTLGQVGTLMWVVGVGVFMTPVLVGLWQMRRLRRTALPWLDGPMSVSEIASFLDVRRELDVVLHESVAGPITYGVRRPTIILPLHAPQWDEALLKSALIHELEHVARRDFLTHCMSRVLCAVYWFHPLVWAAWRQLGLEAERACDDAVLRREDARKYASLLVSIARQQSPARHQPVLAMASRGDLSARVAAVLDECQSRGRIGVRRAIALVAGGIVMMMALASVTFARGMQQTPNTGNGGASDRSFEAASIRQNRSGAIDRTVGFQPTRLRASNATVRMLLGMAFGTTDTQGRNRAMPAWQILSGPGWLDTDGYDIEATTSSPTSPAELRLMMRALLVERFKLHTREGVEEQPFFALVMARGDRRLGPKLKIADGKNCLAAGGAQPVEKKLPPCGGGYQQHDSKAFIANNFSITMDRFALNMQNLVARQVVNETGRTELFDVLNFRFVPPPTAPSPTNEPLSSVIRDDGSEAPLFTALEEQLGLKLEPRRGPMPVVVVESIERPTEN